MNKTQDAQEILESIQRLGECRHDVVTLNSLNQSFNLSSHSSLHNLSRRSVEEEFPHLYAHGCTLRDVCAECTKFIADVISSSRRSLDILNNTPKRVARAADAAATAAAAAVVTERLHPHHQSHLKPGSQPGSNCHPPSHPKSQDHPQPSPQSNHQQQSLHMSLVLSDWHCITLLSSINQSPQIHSHTYPCTATHYKVWLIGLSAAQLLLGGGERFL